jgi:predicted phosphoadenosine phosphosulfate sulfurtransferase
MTANLNGNGQFLITTTNTNNSTSDTFNNTTTTSTTTNSNSTSRSLNKFCSWNNGTSGVFVDSNHQNTILIDGIYIYIYIYKLTFFFNDTRKGNWLNERLRLDTFLGENASTTLTRSTLQV